MKLAPRSDSARRPIDEVGESFELDSTSHRLFYYEQNLMTRASLDHIG